MQETRFRTITYTAKKKGVGETKLWRTYSSRAEAEAVIREWEAGENPESQWAKTYRIANEGGEYAIYQKIEGKRT